MEETDAVNGFKISANAGGSGVKAAGVADEYVYALFGRRERFKDRLNKKSWTLTLSGSSGDGRGANKLHLTDDSLTVAAVATP